MQQVSWFSFSWKFFEIAVFSLLCSGGAGLPAGQCHSIISKKTKNKNKFYYLILDAFSLLYALHF